MEKSRAICAVALIMLTVIATVDAGKGYGATLGIYRSGLSLSGCKGSIAECLANGEYEFDSETSRRILASNGKYISYGALQRNNVPCSQRGSSYYNCQKGGRANPYNRGCSQISRCRG